ncbi:hypothetical protein KJ059_09460 [Myxococcota bacterium]|nr:hypothetical protein [Myxococcota bacterium]
MGDSIAREPWGNDLVATAVRLLANMNTRWARDGLSPDQGCVIELSAGQLMDLTGSGSLVRARRILRALAAHVTLTIEERGTFTRVAWRKVADFQQWPSGTRADPGPHGPPEAPPPNQTRDTRPAASVDDLGTSLGGECERGGGLRATSELVPTFAARTRLEPQRPIEKLSEACVRLGVDIRVEKPALDIMEALPWPVILECVDQTRTARDDGKATNPAGLFLHLARQRLEQAGAA